MAERRDPRWIYGFGGGAAEGHAGMRDLLGGKGADLAEMTRLGMGPAEMKLVAKLILRVLDNPADDAEIARVRGEVHELAGHFPLYAKRLG